MEDQPKGLIQIFDAQKDSAIPAPLRAKAFEKQEDMYCQALDIEWQERRIIVYSVSYAEQQNRRLNERMDKAEQALNTLLQAKQGKKKLKTRAEVELAVEQLLKKHKVYKFIEVQVKQQVHTTVVRKYGKRPGGLKEKLSFSLAIQTNEEVLEKHRQNLGWRVYATNAPDQRLSTKQAVICYRQEYRIEHKFNELLNKITALMPVYLKKDNRIKALIRLLLLALKFVSLIQHQVRQKLTKHRTTDQRTLSR